MKIKTVLVACLALAGLALGQKVKSKNEQDAVMAVFNATTPDAKIAAVDNLLSKFKDTEFKPAVLTVAAQAAQQKGDAPNAIVYGQRAIEADPKSFQAMLIVAGQLAQTTREFDLDKDEKIKRVTKLSNDAMAAVNSSAKPNPQLTEDQWAGIKKDLLAQAHETLGVIASVDKKWDAAVSEFKTAVDEGATPEPSTMLRLAAAYTASKQYDEATALVDKVLAMPNLADNFKKIAQDEKQRAARAKAGTK